MVSLVFRNARKVRVRKWRQDRKQADSTWVVNDGHFAIGLFDFQLSGCGLHAQRVVVGSIHDHFGYLWGYNSRERMADKENNNNSGFVLRKNREAKGEE